MQLPEKMQSRKLWLALAGSMLPPMLSFLSAEVPLHEALRLSAVAVLGYLMAQGYVDGKTMEGWIPDNLKEGADDA